MAINYTAPSIRAKNIIQPTSDVGAALGLTSSPYKGLQQFKNQNLYYGNGQLYEAYAPGPEYFYRNTPYGITETYNPTVLSAYGYTNPSPPVNNMWSQYTGSPTTYSGGWQRGGGDVEGTIRVGDQAFKPYTGDAPKGFTYVDDKDNPSYQISMVDLLSQPTIKAQPNRMFSNVAGYTPASNNLLGTVQPTGTSYGAGQYLNSGLLGGGFNFGTPSGKTAG